MSKRGAQTHAKRLREYARKDKRRAKDERRALRKAAKDAPGDTEESLTDAVEPVAAEA
jgi:hypothetical protein